MREKIGLAIAGAVLLYTLLALAWSLLAKPCSVCGKLTVFTARIGIRSVRRERVCWRDRQWLRGKGLLRPRRGRPYRPVPSESTRISTRAKQ